MPPSREIKRLGVIGDVHAEHIFLRKAVDYLKKNNIDKILCTGDISDGIGDVDRCCEILMKENITSVMGNHDRWLINNNMRNLPDATRLNGVSRETFDYLSGLPKTIELQTIIGSIMLCHGIGTNDMGQVMPGDSDKFLESKFELQELVKRNYHRILLNGHTHFKMVRKLGNMVLINAGTLKRDHGPGFLIADLIEKIAIYYNIDSRLSIMENTVIPLDI